MVLDSQQMHISFTRCLRVVASHLEVIAPARSPNTDGIHISASKGVEVKDSIIKTGWLSTKSCNKKLYSKFLIIKNIILGKLMLSLVSIMHMKLLIYISLFFLLVLKFYVKVYNWVPGL